MPILWLVPSEIVVAAQIIPATVPIWEAPERKGTAEAVPLMLIRVDPRESAATKF
jgi:hypothetical protein